MAVEAPSAMRPLAPTLCIALVAFTAPAVGQTLIVSADAWVSCGLEHPDIPGHTGQNVRAHASALATNAKLGPTIDVAFYFEASGLAQFATQAQPFHDSAVWPLDNLASINGDLAASAPFGTFVKATATASASLVPTTGVDAVDRFSTTDQDEATGTCSVPATPCDPNTANPYCGGTVIGEGLSDCSQAQGVSPYVLEGDLFIDPAATPRSYAVLSNPANDQTSLLSWTAAPRFDPTLSTAVPVTALPASAVRTTHVVWTVQSSQAGASCTLVERLQ